MTRAYDSVNRRYVELTARDHNPACDEHVHCVCGGLMAYDNRGLLVCQDCRTDALADPESWEPPEVDR